MPDVTRFMIRVAVFCEYSGIVRDAFRGRGFDARSFDARSIDLLSSDRPGPHFQTTVEQWWIDSGAYRNPQDWLIVAFPPCTYLAVSGARWFAQRRAEQESAIRFVRWIDDRPVPYLAIKNPIGVLSTRFRKPDQIVQPRQFGHGETKATCFWLRGLPKLRSTSIVDARRPRVHFESPGPDRWKRRSTTLQGIADAMAQQWGDAIR